MDLKYKIGDKVKVKSHEWYEDNANYLSEIECGNTVFIPDMKCYCGTTVTIMKRFSHIKCYSIEEDNGVHYWSDEMFECGDDSDMKEFAAKVLNIKNEIIVPDNCEVWDDQGNVIKTSKIIIREVKKTYPNTINDCYNLLEDDELASSTSIGKFQELINARNAYWKIAGTEMGLGRSWEPNWTSFEGYPAIYMYRYQITLSVARDEHHCLVFPTEAIRDKFYKNFKKEIAECKEFL
jgi:hypothetical protein